MQLISRTLRSANNYGSNTILQIMTCMYTCTVNTTALIGLRRDPLYIGLTGLIQLHKAHRELGLNLQCVLLQLTFHFFSIFTSAV